MAAALLRSSETHLRAESSRGEGLEPVRSRDPGQGDNSRMLAQLFLVESTSVAVSQTRRRDSAVWTRKVNTVLIACKYGLEDSNECTDDYLIQFLSPHCKCKAVCFVILL